MNHCLVTPLFFHFPVTSLPRYDTKMLTIAIVVKCSVHVSFLLNFTVVANNAAFDFLLAQLELGGKLNTLGDFARQLLLGIGN